MKIAIIGRTSTLMETAKKLLENNMEIVMVVTSPAAPEYSVTEDDYKNFANSINAQYICTNKINDYEEELKKAKCDIAISINYSSTISQEIVDCFEMGILNAHLGDLPRYRGNATVNWAIINGEKNIPLCIQYMIGGELDSGAVIGKEYKEITIDTKVRDIYNWIEEITPQLYLDVLAKLQQNQNYIIYEQSSKMADIIRCYPRIPEDSKIDWTKSNIEIVRLINASSKPFSGAYSFYNEKKIIFEDVELHNDSENYYAIPGQVSQINKQEKYITIITGSGKIKVNKIIVDGVESFPTDYIKWIRKRFVS